MLRRSSDGSRFATGRGQFLTDLPGVAGGLPRIFVDVTIASARTYAALDTGGGYVVCDPEFANLAMIPAGAECVGTAGIEVRGRLYSGTLYRTRMELIAHEGSSLELEGVAFVPSLNAGATWPLPPAVLGFRGMLEYVRFAIDPRDESFYFGSC